MTRLLKVGMALPIWLALAACAPPEHAARAQVLQFDFSEPAPAGDLVAGPGGLSRAQANEYISFFEWYFELRFTDDERSAYEALIARKWQRDQAFHVALASTVDVMQAVQAMSYADAARLRTEKRTSGAMEAALLSGIGGGGPPPQEVRNQIVELARTGDEEAAWLLARIEAAQKPLVTADSPLARPFTRQHVDAAVDLLVFRANAVAGEERIMPTEQMRSEMRAFLIDAWRSDPASQSELYLWLTGVTADWGAVAHSGGRWPASAITPYQLRRTLRDWAVQTTAWFPELAPAARLRIDEYEHYVSAMSPQEMAMELGFQANAAATAESSAAALQAQIEASHVVNLNAIEAIGGSREWSYRLETSEEAHPK